MRSSSMTKNYPFQSRVRRVEHLIFACRGDQHDGRADLGQRLQDTLHLRVLPGVGVANVASDVIDVLTEPMIDDHVTSIGSQFVRERMPFHAVLEPKADILSTIRRKFRLIVDLAAAPARLAELSPDTGHLHFVVDGGDAEQSAAQAASAAVGISGRHATSRHG